MRQRSRRARDARTRLARWAGQVCLCIATLAASTGTGTENIVNGTFDTEVVTGWTLNNGTREWSSFDADGSPSSRSALLTNSPASSSHEVLFQCGPVNENSDYAIGAEFWIPSGQGNPGMGFLGIYTYASDACSGADLSYSSTDSTATDVDRWVALHGVLAVPAGAASAHVRIVVSRLNTGTFAAYLDDVSLLRSCLFCDGFESGDLSAWSSSAP